MLKLSRSDYFETGIDCDLEEGWLPKIKNKKHFNFTVLNTYKIYLDNCKKKGKTPVSKDQYIIFLDEYFRLLSTRIIEEGFIFILPYHMGRFYLNKSRRVGFFYAKENEEVILKQTLNLHTFRKFYNIKWDKSLGYFKNRNLWKYKASEAVKSKLSSFIFKYNRPIIEKPLIGHGFRETKWN